MQADDNDASADAAPIAQQQQQPAWRPLHQAVRRRRVDDVRALLSGGGVANVDAKARYGRTPFDLAASAGDLDIMRALLEAGADPNQKVKPRGSKRRPAVHFAVIRNNEQMLELLLEFGASPNVVWDRQTPLFRATLDRKEKLVRRLLARDAETETVCRDRLTALFVACVGKQEAVARLLLEAGASPNFSSVAFNTGHRVTVLAMTCAMGNVRLVELLLDFGADVDQTFMKSKVTALVATLVNQSTDRDKCEIVRLLIAHGADIAATSTEGYTPLIAAAFSGCVEAVRLFLDLLAATDQLDASLNPPAGHLYSPLDSACKEAKHVVVEMLLDAGASVTARINDRSPLMAAVISSADAGDKLRTVELLAKRGADVNWKDPDGFSALLFACFQADQSPALVELLLRHGADPDPRTGVSGMTPLLAMCLGPVDDEHDAAQVVGVLVEHEADVEAISDGSMMAGPAFVEAAMANRDETVDQLFDHLLDFLPCYDDD